MCQDPFERGLDIKQAQLRGVARSIAEVEWLLLALVMLYLFVTAPEYVSRISVIRSLLIFAGLVLGDFTLGCVWSLIGAALGIPTYNMAWHSSYTL